MPICIECRHPVKTLWREGSGPAGGGQGHNIRLTVCKNCGRFCDKYVEHDFVVLFIDLVLIKPQVYRHLLHNTLMKGEKDEFAPSIIRLGVLLLLFDVYLTWARVERQGGGGGGGGGADWEGGGPGQLADKPIGVQYIFFRKLSIYLSIYSCFSGRAWGDQMKPKEDGGEGKGRGGRRPWHVC